MFVVDLTPRTAVSTSLPPEIYIENRAVPTNNTRGETDTYWDNSLNGKCFEEIFLEICCLLAELYRVFV